MRFDEFRFIPFSAAHAELMLSWKYPPPYDFYNFPAEAGPGLIEQVLGRAEDYFAIVDSEGEMIGFRTFGPSARIEGGDYRQDALDISGGLRPDYMARGLGRQVTTAAMTFGLEKYQAKRFRTTLPSFNERAKSICRSLGFSSWSEFVRVSDNVRFEVWVARAPSHQASGWGGTRSPGFYA